MHKPGRVEPSQSIAADALSALSLEARLRKRFGDIPSARSSGTKGGRRAMATERIRQLEQLLEESTQTPVTLLDVARLLHLEETYCSKVFRQITGKSFSCWLRAIRIRRAQTLLQVSGASITDVCHAGGFEDLTTFGRNFRKEPARVRRHFDEWPRKWTTPRDRPPLHLLSQPVHKYSIACETISPKKH